jgi:hypothetical protein
VISPDIAQRTGGTPAKPPGNTRSAPLFGEWHLTAVFKWSLQARGAGPMFGRQTTPCRHTTLPGDFLSFGGCASRSKTSSNVQRRTARQASFAAQQRSAAPKMTIENHAGPRSLRSKPAWANVWHVWTVIIPRRSITGRLVFGQVWRRHDGRRWIYKKFIEYRIER